MEFFVFFCIAICFVNLFLLYENWKYGKKVSVLNKKISDINLNFVELAKIMKDITQLGGESTSKTDDLIAEFIEFREAVTQFAFEVDSYIQKMEKNKSSITVSNPLKKNEKLN